MPNCKLTSDFSLAAQAIKAGGVIAYPTEAVFGLGCDPNNELAVKKLLALKQRPIEKGLILIAANWQQLIPFVETQTLSPELVQQAKATWPGPVTWLFPAKQTTPIWLRGQHSTIAVRITAHPIARTICETAGQAIVSTSANVLGEEPLRDAQSVLQVFPDGLELIVQGELGGLEKPTVIWDLVTGEVVR